MNGTPGPVPADTFDQDLLAWLGDETPSVRDHDAALVHEIAGEFARGFDALSGIGRAVTFFGSARTPVHHPDYALVRSVAAAVGGPDTRSSPAAAKA